ASGPKARWTKEIPSRAPTPNLHRHRSRAHDGAPLQSDAALGRPTDDRTTPWTGRLRSNASAEALRFLSPAERNAAPALRNAGLSAWENASLAHELPEHAADFLQTSSPSPSR